MHYNEMRIKKVIDFVEALGGKVRIDDFDNYFAGTTTWHLDVDLPHEHEGPDD